MKVILFFCIAWLASRAEAAVDPIQFIDCQLQLSVASPHLLEQEHVVLAGWAGREILMLGRPKLESPYLFEIFSNVILAPDLLIRLVKENGSFFLHVRSRMASADMRLLLGAPDVISHTSGLLKGDLLERAQILRPLIFPADRTPTGLFLGYPLQQKIPFVSVYLRTTTCPPNHTIDDTWFNRDGKLVCLEKLAVVEVLPSHLFSR